MEKKVKMAATWGVRSSSLDDKHGVLDVSTGRRARHATIMRHYSRTYVSATFSN